MSDQVEVTKLPTCNMCKCKPASYDAKTMFGYWAYLCDDDWVLYRLSPKLGTGFGQRLVVIS